MTNILVGAGGNVIDAISFSQITSLGNVLLVDDIKKGTFCGYPIIGTIDDLIRTYDTIDNPVVYNCVGSAGNNTIRNNVYEKLLQAGIKANSLCFSKNISGEVTIGDNTLIGVNSVISHNCEIGDNVVISPSVTLCGNVKLGKNVFVGAGATIIQGITIGDNVVIGAGSVVIRDIPSNLVVVGNPAREIRKNKNGRLSF